MRLSYAPMMYRYILPTTSVESIALALERGRCPGLPSIPGDALPDWLERLATTLQPSTSSGTWQPPTRRGIGFARRLLDDDGRPQPATNRFPSAAGARGFAPLGAPAHRLGLRFDAQPMRVLPRQPVDCNSRSLGAAPPK